MFGKLRNSVVGKIIAGYALIICLAFVTTLVSMYTTYNNRKIDRLVSEAYYPMVLSLKETEILLSDSYKLTNNWIYQPSVKEKEKLKVLHSADAARQSESLLQITGRFENDSANVQTAALLRSLDELLKEEKTVMQKLATDESYSDDVAVDEAITAMDEKITPAFNTLTRQINESLKEQNQLLDAAKAEKEAASTMLTYLYISNLLLFAFIGVYATYFSMNSVTKPIAALSDLILLLSKGKFVSVTLKKSRDEIGRMGEAIEDMLTGLKKKIEFAESIGNGNYESRFELLSEDDAMGEALMQMRDNLSKASEEDRKRNWATEGLAKFADILRAKNNNIDDLSDNIIRNLVKYMNANQGALFLINDDDKNDPFLEMIGCYAYDRKKHLKSRVDIGQGITGQTVLEKGTVYMTQIPNDYLRITSGLGEALPRNLLIVPLKMDDTVFGVVELASFESIDKYKIEFVERLGESIASTISSVKVSERTKMLLGESQQQAEEMRAQEEEMRQNMEELSATQEDMQRVLNEAQSKERYMNELINVSTDAIFTLDKEFNILDCNQYFANRLKGMGVEVAKGFHILNLFKEEEKERHKAEYQRALDGESFELTNLSVINGNELYLSSVYSPMRDVTGAIIAIACFTKDITELMSVQRKAIDQQRYYNDVIEAMSDCVVTIDKEYKIVVANTAFKEVFAGYGLSVEPGSSLLAMAKGDRKAEEQFKKPYVRAFAGEHVEEPHRHHFDREFQVSYNPLRDANGEIIGVSLMAHDITQTMQLSN